MTSTHTTRNVAARMGRWSAGHWKTATFGWLAFVAVAFALGGMVGMETIDSNAPGPGESGRMDRILDEGFAQPAGEHVLVQSQSLRIDDAAFKATVADVVSGLSTLKDVENLHSPLEPGRAGQVSKDGRAALVEFDIRGSEDDAVDKVGPVIDRVAEIQRAHPAFQIGQFGDASARKGVDTAYADDLGKAGMLSLPITLIILIATFGALVAAGIPLLLALTAVFATFGLVALPSHLMPVAMEAPAMVLLIGLAVGVDYSMFYLKRWRQERAAGRSERAAIEAAAATSGRSVLVSGLTVMVAMAGMFLTGDRIFSSLALATILVVAVAVLGSLTVLPALLSRLGDRVNRLRVPFLGGRDDGESRFWGAIVDRVLRRPALSAAVAGAMLLALAFPALQLRLAPQGAESFPQSLEVMKTYKRMQQAFPGSALPANVVVKAPNVNAPAARTAIERLKHHALASGQMYEPITIEVNRDATVANITVPIAGNGTDDASNAAFALLRGSIVPETVGAVPDAEAGVTGMTASWKDQASELRSNLTPVVAFVLLFAFVLMLVAFRSVVIAGKAILLNLLSVAAAYGVLTWIFQDGHLESVLGFHSVGGITSWLPLFLFVILFGLSMDYHVFIISRIREAVSRGESTDGAITHGIKSTAGVVTSAAIVMVFVFAIFGLLSMPFFKQFGVGLAAAVLIDATIVRAVLLPASMKLLGDWNWYLPKWLEWLPQLEFGEPDLEIEAEDAPKRELSPTEPAIQRKRVFTMSRIIGLLLIGVVAIGLGYVASSSQSAVSVPDGAKAGDISMKPCTYGTEDGGYEADCGTLVVPENRNEPQSRLIALPVKRIRALSERPAEPIFRLQGGPGVTNMTFPEASRFVDRHDVVLVGYRGMDGSAKLDCPEVESAMKRSTDLLSEKSYRARGDAFRACADRLTDEGFDLAGYSLPQRVDDLEAARKALGYDRIDLVSESAGTRTAMIYSWRYPKSIHRSVMVGANPPGHFVWDAQTTDEQIRRYAALCAKDASCSRRTPDLAAALHSAFANIPDRWWFLPIREGNVKAGAFFGLMEATTDGNGPLAAPWTIDMLLSTDKGDGSGAWFMSLMAQVAFPSEFFWGDVLAVARTDAAHARHIFESRSDGRSLIGIPGADLIWAGGELVDAWPATPDQNDYAQVRDSNIDTLLVGGNLDAATPPQWATRDLLPHLPNGRQVVLRDLGHSGDFWAYQPTASTRLVNTFLESGSVDTSLYRHNSVDFTPVISHGEVAKIVLGAMLGLAALTVLSLAWMARRVRKRGGYGRKASAVLRSVYPIVLGLGGWLVGVTVVLVAFPSVPLDDPLLGVLGVGVPVGLGVYLAWVNGKATGTGFVAAVAGALVGAWLGLQATTDLVGLLAAIAGAIAGANLALIVIDMAREGSAQRAVVATTSPATPTVA